MSMKSVSRRCAVACLLVAGAWSGTAWADEAYPNRPIRIVVPVAPGFNTDNLARLLAEELRKNMKIQVIVENKAGGAGGSVGADYVARSKPDGYTLLFSSPGPLGVNKVLYKELGYDPLAFTPISLTSESTNVLLVRAEAPFQSIKELVAFAKANPGKLNYGSGGVGTSTHLSSELFKTQTGTDIVHVPFKGSAATVTGLMSGQVDMFFGELGMSLPHIKSGRLRALGVGSLARHELLPDVPSVSEVLPGFTSTVWYGVVAPPATPKDIVDKLSAWTVQVMKQPEIQARIRDLGGHVIARPSAEFGKFMKDDLAYWQKVIVDAKIPRQ
ncbi:tripartite tricarboxylate transporter substrate binding protein [Pigmentiphaga sp. H8]|uniref:Bug family tripartite tricarboxylate transporter substrate binding protein n=1 Tax=Pigmentiphaga sp. H8 TaxID=2488560 RepID=UPI000F58F756|nr:tripartite tricarboxylate transporter substrate binding protein [Pigmentiphaga sp. H8]AZG08231.1 tripartite tricarboxylate transporter substrate binding protein [Pigmentiphaga sp. H8]